jgi:solute carrier family 35 protein F1/2
MAAIQPEPRPTATGYYGNKSDVSVEREVDKTGAGINVSSENEQAGTATMGNPTLEAVAQTKGRWFQYVKTKQFWITLLLGQGTSISIFSNINHIWVCRTDMRNY